MLPLHLLVLSVLALLAHGGVPPFRALAAFNASFTRRLSTPFSLAPATFEWNVRTWAAPYVVVCAGDEGDVSANLAR